MSFLKWEYAACKMATICTNILGSFSLKHLGCVFLFKIKNVKKKRG